MCNVMQEGEWVFAVPSSKVYELLRHRNGDQQVEFSVYKDAILTGAPSVHGHQGWTKAFSKGKLQAPQLPTWAQKILAQPEYAVQLKHVCCPGGGPYASMR